MHLYQDLKDQLPLINEEIRLQFNGLETTMLEDLLDLLGHLHPIPILHQHSTLEFNKSTVTKLVDVDPATLLTLTEEMMVLEMEVTSHVNQPLLYPATSLMASGHFNGLGLVELLLLETTTHASMSRYLAEPTLLRHPFLLEATIQTQEHRSASSLTPTSFTNAFKSHAISHCFQDSRPVYPHSYKSTSMGQSSPLLLDSM